MPHAIVIQKPGDASVLCWEERDPGDPGPGQVQVSLRAAGMIPEPQPLSRTTRK